MSENKKKPLTREELEKEIIKKAQSDKDFKKVLVDNPKETLGKLGVQVPEEVEVKVVEESAKVVYLVLPVNLDELTDEHLDEVVGGTSYCIAVYRTCFEVNEDCFLWWGDLTVCKKDITSR